MGHFLLKAPKSIFHGLSSKQRDDQKCYIIKYSATVLVLYDKCNQKVEQRNGAERELMVSAHSRPHFLENERLFMVSMYTETDNVLEI